MPSSISGFLAGELLRLVFNNFGGHEPLPTIYIELLTAAPNNYFYGGGSIQGSSLSRLAIANNSTNFPSASTIGLVTQKVNGTTLSFGTAGSALSFVGFGFYDSATGGTWLGGGSFTVPLDFASGVAVTIAPGGVAIGINTASAGGCSGYVCRRMLDLAFGAVAYTKPSNFGAYFTTAPNYATGAGGVEAAGGGYSRVETTGAGGINDGNEQIFASSSLPIDSNIIFANPTADQGTAVAGGIFDAASGGNLLCGGDLAVPRNLVSGSTGVFFEVYSIQVRILSVD